MPQEEIHVCSKCKKEVTEKTVVKKSLEENIHIFTPGVKVWTPKGSNEQWGLFCPHCDYLHAFGFRKKQ